jgi:hypothetical protein
MNWSHFILILTGVYLAYYGINLIADLCLTKKPPAPENDQERLFFDETIEPQLITYEEDTEQPQVVALPPENSGSLPGSTLESTGAVNLKELFRLAQNNLIDYTGAIRY